MNTRDEIVRTHLEDLQSEMEAGARQVNTIATEMRHRMLARHLEQADLAGKLVRQITQLQKSVQQQLQTLTELRREIRNRHSVQTALPRDLTAAHQTQGRGPKT